MTKNMSRFFKPLYVMIVFISLFLVVRDVKAGKTFHSSFSTFLLYLIYKNSALLPTHFARAQLNFPKYPCMI